MNTPTWKGHDDQLGYQITKRESIKYDSKTVSDVNMVPVSYEFIDIKGLEFEKRFYKSEANSGQM
jgi:putative ABC transport system permease protein